MKDVPKKDVGLQEKNLREEAGYCLDSASRRARSKALESYQPRVKSSAGRGQITRSYSKELQGQMLSAERGPTLGRRQ